MGRITLDNVEDVFTYQPIEPDQKLAYDAVREASIKLAQTILTNVPDCADRTVALRKLRECRMDANAAIALRGML